MATKQRLEALAEQGLGPIWAEFSTRQEAEIEFIVKRAMKEGHELAQRLINEEYGQLWRAEHERKLRAMDRGSLRLRPCGRRIPNERGRPERCRW